MDESLFSRLATEQPLRDAAFTLGGLLLQPRSGGQTTSGQIGDALIKSLGVMRQGQSAEKAAQVEQQKLGLEERRTAATEQQADTSAKSQASTAQYNQGILKNMENQQQETTRHNQAVEQDAAQRRQHEQRVLSLDERKLKSEQTVQSMKVMEEWEKNDRAMLDAGMLTPQEFQERWNDTAYRVRLDALNSLFDTGQAKYVRPGTGIDTTKRQPPASGDEAFAEILSMDPTITPGSPKYKEVERTVRGKYPGWQPKAGDDLQRSMIAAQQAQKSREAAVRAQTDWEQRANAFTTSMRALATEQDVFRAAQELTKMEEEGLKMNLRGNHAFESRILNMKGMLQDKLLMLRSKGPQEPGITRRPEDMK